VFCIVVGKVPGAKLSRCNFHDNLICFLKAHILLVQYMGRFIAVDFVLSVRGSVVGVFVREDCRTLGAHGQAVASSSR